MESSFVLCRNSLGWRNVSERKGSIVHTNNTVNKNFISLHARSTFASSLTRESIVHDLCSFSFLSKKQQESWILPLNEIFWEMSWWSDFCDLLLWDLGFYSSCTGSVYLNNLVISFPSQRGPKNTLYEFSREDIIPRLSKVGYICKWKRLKALFEQIDAIDLK